RRKRRGRRHHGARPGARHHLRRMGRGGGPRPGPPRPRGRRSRGRPGARSAGPRGPLRYLGVPRLRRGFPCAHRRAVVRGDPTAEELFGGRDVTVGAATGVLVQTILEILDTPLLLEADNSRSGEVSAALVERLGVSEQLLPSFDELFAEVPVSGMFSGGEGLPERYGFTPREYPSDGPRMHVLQSATAVEMLDLPEIRGPLVLASAQGALPIETDD